MLICDAHAHWDSEDECALRQTLKLPTVLSVSTPEQARTAFEAARRYNNIYVSAGLHPWYTGDVSLKSMENWIKKAPIIGEIGMDSIWCDVPAEIQRTALIAQLNIAEEMRKPVVLHTKGCEAEIAQIINSFDLTFLVHWYSGSEALLKPYLDLDCYFTIGPDIDLNPAVQCVARQVRPERILFETDGMEAVKWALGDMPTECLPRVLENSARCAANIKNMDADVLCVQAYANFKRLLNLK